MKDYLADPGISSSQLKYILRSPADFKAVLEQKSEDTKATIFGTAVHSMLLEPHKFHYNYAIQSEDWGPKNKGEGKKKWDAFKSLNAGKIILDFEASAKISKIIRAEMLHESFRDLRRSFQHIEKSFFFDHPKYGRLKCRPDIITNDGFIWDVKTTSKDIDDESLSKTIYFMTYHFQAAHYIYIMRLLQHDIKGFGWIFVSTDTPAVHIVMRKATDELLAAGASDHAQALSLLKHCRETNSWPGMPSKIEYIGLPKFAERIYE